VNVAMLKKYSHRLMRGPLALEIKKVPTAIWRTFTCGSVTMGQYTCW
jgi:hypothetical protein